MAKRSSTTRLWKQVEQRFANLFGTDRRPLSGGNSKSGRDDIRHPVIFAEVKHRQDMAAVKLYNKTRALALKEHKIPVLGLHMKGQQGFLVCCHSDDLIAIAQEMAEAQSQKLLRFQQNLAKASINEL